MGIGFDLTGILRGNADRVAEFHKDARSWQSRIRMLASRRLFSAMDYPGASREEGKRKDDTKGGGDDGRSV